MVNGFKEIQKRLLGSFPSDIDTRQGSIVGDLTTGTALELAEAYMQIQKQFEYSFLGVNTPNYIVDLKASELGVYRKAAGKSTVNVTVSGDEGLVIDYGTRFRTTVNNLIFTSIDTYTIDNTGSVVVSLESEYGGSEYNVPSGSITTILGDLSGVVEVVNSEAATGGYDEESNESVIERINDKLRTPATSGNVHHYRNWAKEVTGVQDAKVQELARGNGTVDVILLAEGNKQPSDELIKAVEDYIEDGRRPVGADVLVKGADAVTLNIKGNVYLVDGYEIEEVTKSYQELLDTKLVEYAFKGNTIIYSQIVALLQNIKGVSDWNNITINDRMENIELKGTEIAQVGTINFTEVGK